jgi:hypothetical protein
MKKLGIALLAVTLIALASLPVLAAVDVPVFEGTFVRKTGEPVIETIIFSGISGPATITLWNGGLADSSTEKVSSSEIRVNGVLIFGPHNFNQKVSALQAEVILQEGDNSLEVLLRSKPGGTITIQVVQNIDPPPVGGYRLPDTGQTKCYDTSTVFELTSCPQPGEPFYGQDGNYEGPQPSYQPSDDGLTVTDLNTGLIWQQSYASEMNWDEAVTYCEDMNLGGFWDWRLPSRMELVTILDYGRRFPAINPAFSSLSVISADNFYWSSSTQPFPSGGAWYVEFGEGSVGAIPKDYTHYVRCVRGEPLPFGPFLDNEDGTVTDEATNLMWQQGYAAGMTWAEALSYCEGLSLAGHNEWRLPNIREFHSIVDDSRTTPALDPVFSSALNLYQSGTPWSGGWYYLWMVNSTDGYSGLAHMLAGTDYVRCVRGGE